MPTGGIDLGMYRKSKLWHHRESLTVSQSPCTALMTDICLPYELYKGAISALWKIMEIHTGHVSTLCKLWLQQSKPISRLTNQKSLVPADWRLCLVSHFWQPYCHPARTVKQFRRELDRCDVYMADRHLLLWNLNKHSHHSHFESILLREHIYSPTLHPVK